MLHSHAPLLCPLTLHVAGTPSTTFPSADFISDQIAKVRTLFSSFGPIDDIRLPPTSYGTLKGFAYVQFKHASSANAAMHAVKYKLKVFELLLEGRKFPLRITRAYIPTVQHQQLLPQIPAEIDADDTSLADRTLPIYEVIDGEINIRKRSRDNILPSVNPSIYSQSISATTNDVIGVTSDSLSDCRVADEEVIPELLFTKFGKDDLIQIDEMRSASLRTSALLKLSQHGQQHHVSSTSFKVTDPILNSTEMDVVVDVDDDKLSSIGEIRKSDYSIILEKDPVADTVVDVVVVENDQTTTIMWDKVPGLLHEHLDKSPADFSHLNDSLQEETIIKDGESVCNNVHTIVSNTTVNDAAPSDDAPLANSIFVVVPDHEDPIVIATTSHDEKSMDEHQRKQEHILQTALDEILTVPKEENNLLPNDNPCVENIMKIDPIENGIGVGDTAQQEEEEEDVRSVKRIFTTESNNDSESNKVISLNCVPSDDDIYNPLVDENDQIASQIYDIVQMSVDDPSPPTLSIKTEELRSSTVFIPPLMLQSVARDDQDNSPTYCYSLSSSSSDGDYNPLSSSDDYDSSQGTEEVLLKEEESIRSIVKSRAPKNKKLRVIPSAIPPPPKAVNDIPVDCFRSEMDVDNSQSLILPVKNVVAVIAVESELIPLHPTTTTTVSSKKRKRNDDNQTFYLGIISFGAVASASSSKASLVVMNDASIQLKDFHPHITREQHANTLLLTLPLDYHLHRYGKDIQRGVTIDQIRDSFIPPRISSRLSSLDPDDYSQWIEQISIPSKNIVDIPDPTQQDLDSTVVTSLAIVFTDEAVKSVRGDLVHLITNCSCIAKKSPLGKISWLLKVI